MKKLLLFPILMVVAASCGNQKNEAAATSAGDSLQFFGDRITAEGAMPADQLAAKMEGHDSLRAKITGEITEVCQKKGCWMTMEIGGNKKMQVRFKNYAFFVPKDASGKHVTIEGVAFTDTTSVEGLRHYAEDAGKSKEEIAKINAPEINIAFEADGVIIGQ